jgi:hypothetical protein
VRGLELKCESAIAASRREKDSSQRREEKKIHRKGAEGKERNAKGKRKGRKELEGRKGNGVRWVLHDARLLLRVLK